MPEKLTPPCGRALLPATLFATFVLVGASAAALAHTLPPAATASADPVVIPVAEGLLTRARQLTYEGRRSGEGYFSPDGRRLVFQSEREPGNPFYQIYTLDLESGDVRRISPGVGKTTCGFFRPGADEILFASTHRDPAALQKQEAEFAFRASGKRRRYSWDYDAEMEIYSARADGGGLRRLTDSPGYDAEGAYSPDGAQIVFSSLRGAYPPEEKLGAEERKRLEVDPAYFGEIYIMGADGSDPRRLTRTPGYDGGPFFSPGGDRIVWRRFDEDGLTADIYTMRTDGSDERRLTGGGAMAWAPFFHPSGEYVIFTSNRLGFDNFELFIVDAAGAKEPVRVTGRAGFDGLPVFSPEGEKLAWTSNATADKASQLFLGRWDHRAARAALEAAPERVGESGRSRAAGVSHAHSAAPAAPAAPAGNLPGAPPVPGAGSPEIAVADLEASVGYLASDALGGRMTGSPGERAAGDYLARSLAALGFRPMGDGGETFFHGFTFTSSVETAAEGNTLEVALEGHGGKGKTTPFEVEKDFRPLAFTDSGEVEGGVVFAGYGLVVPGGLGEGYDSYAGLDVEGKVVLVLRYVPEGVGPERRAELNRYAGLRYKAMIARERGAAALLVVTGPNSPNAGKLIGHAFDSSLSGSGLLVASVTGEVAAALLAGGGAAGGAGPVEGKGGAGLDLARLQTALDQENPHAVGGRPLPGVSVSFAARVKQVVQQGRNVIGVLPPAGGEGGGGEYVLLGAHYDHLGTGGESSSSLRTKGEEAAVHNGADDNASGCALILEVAAELAAARERNPAAFKRGVVAAFWSGEEIGLIGSARFAENPTVDLDRVVAYLNFDMVGRLREERLVLQGVGSSPAWKRLIEKRNVAAGFDLVLQEDPYLPTDVTSFYPRGVPVLNFFTGSHADYHRPSDDPDTLDYEGLARVARFARGITADLLAGGERPAYAKVERSADRGGSRDGLRAYLGTIPDYATEIDGVKLTGVRGGGPADVAGLRGGDVIVGFGGKQIKNIYDYTYALDAVRIGQPVEVIVLRGGRKLKLEVTPKARE